MALGCDLWLTCGFRCISRCFFLVVIQLCRLKAVVWYLSGFTCLLFKYFPVCHFECVAHAVSDGDGEISRAMSLFVSRLWKWFMQFFVLKCYNFPFWLRLHSYCTHKKGGKCFRHSIDNLCVFASFAGILISVISWKFMYVACFRWFFCTLKHFGKNSRSIFGCFFFIFLLWAIWFRFMPLSLVYESEYEFQFHAEQYIYQMNNRGKTYEKKNKPKKAIHLALKWTLLYN